MKKSLEGLSQEQIEELAEQMLAVKVRAKSEIKEMESAIKRCDEIIESKSPEDDWYQICRREKLGWENKIILINSIMREVE